MSVSPVFCRHYKEKMVDLCELICFGKINNLISVEISRGM